MVTIDYKNVHVVTKKRQDGTISGVHYYHRKTRSKLPAPTDPGFPARWQEEEEKSKDQGVKDSNKPDTGTFSALIVAFKSSAEWRQVKETTQKDYAKYLDIVRGKWGHLQVKSLERRHVFALRDLYGETPRKANYLITVLIRLLNWSVDRGWRSDNPAAKPKRLKEGSGWRAWEEHEIAAFRAHWGIGTLERAAFEVLLHTGQRSDDVRVMTRNHFRDGQIWTVQSKTGTRVEMPAAQAVTDALSSWLTHHQDLVLFASSLGKPYNNTVWKHRMGDAIREAGLPTDCVTHGLRYTAATRLRELGLDWTFIADITGHQTAEMARKYSEKRRRSAFAMTVLETSLTSDSTPKKNA